MGARCHFYPVVQGGGPTTKLDVKNGLSYKVRAATLPYFLGFCKPVDNFVCLFVFCVFAGLGLDACWGGGFWGFYPWCVAVIHRPCFSSLAPCTSLDVSVASKV